MNYEIEFYSKTVLVDNHAVNIHIPQLAIISDVGSYSTSYFFVNEEISYLVWLEVTNILSNFPSVSFPKPVGLFKNYKEAKALELFLNQHATSAAHHPYNYLAPDGIGEVFLNENWWTNCSFMFNVYISPVIVVNEI